jgi:hypothetical protein
MTPVDVNREVTPALLRGRRGSVRALREGELARSEPGNITFSAAGLDRFRAACGGLLAQVGEHREHPAVAAVAPVA